MKSYEEIETAVRSQAFTWCKHKVDNGFGKLVDCDKVPYPESDIKAIARKLYENQ